MRFLRYLTTKTVTILPELKLDDGEEWRGGGAQEVIYKMPNLIFQRINSSGPEF